jgi:hypothetical protein
MRYTTTALLILFLIVGLASANVLAFLAAPEVEDDEAIDAKLVEMVREGHRLVEARWKIIDDLNAKRLTLAEAAAKFEELAQDDPFHIEDWLWQQYPDAQSTTELHTRHVLVYAESRPAQPSEPESPSLGNDLDAR